MTADSLDYFEFLRFSMMLVYTVADYHERFNLILRDINFNNVFFENSRIGVLVIESLKTINLPHFINPDDLLNINKLYPYDELPENDQFTTKRKLIQEDFRQVEELLDTLAKK